MGLFGKLFGQNPSIEEKQNQMKVALNAIMANHKLLEADTDTRKLIAKTLAIIVGGDPDSEPSMQDATASLTYIPRIQQMFLVSEVFAANGIAPEINGMSWISTQYVDGISERLIANAIATLMNQCGVNIIWPKASVDFQALYYRGLYIDYGLSFEFITANDAA